MPLSAKLPSILSLADDYYASLGDNYFAYGAVNTSDSNFGFRVTQLTSDVSSVAAVPELSTWGMMFLGLAAVGVVARRRTTGKFAAAHA